jgi:hypothetical protein
MLRGKGCQSNGGSGSLGRAVPDANIVSPPRRLHEQHHVAVSNGNIFKSDKSTAQAEQMKEGALRIL